MANNIDFKSILEYYINDGVMNLEKEQLNNQIMDLLAIIDFLERKVPLKIKTIKNRIDDYHNDLNKVKKSIREITMPQVYSQQGDQKPERLPDLRYLYNIDFAYDNYSKLANFTPLKDQNDFDIDYENMAFREMEVKYLESIGIEKYFKTRGVMFSNNKHLNLTLKKYLAVMSLRVQDSEFLWNLDEIRDNFTRKSQPNHRNYFNTVIMGNLKQKNNESQNLVLATVFHYLSFIDLIDFKQILFRYPVIKDEESEDIFYLQEEQGKLKFQFSSPLKKQEPILKVTYQKQKDLEVTFYWKQSYVQAEMAYLDLNLKLHEALENVTPREVMDIVLDLSDISKVYDQLKKKQQAHLVNLMKDFMYWKLGNYHWYYEKWKESQINHLQGINGIYLSSLVDIEPVLIRITPNVNFESKCASHNFISKIMKGQNDFKVVFIFLDLIWSLSQASDSEGCELDDFGVNEQNVWIDFRQKIVYEDHIIKSSRGDNPDEKSQFTSMSCLVHFDLRFKKINMYVTHFSQPPNPPKPPSTYSHDTNCSERWKSYIQKHQPEERLDLSQVKAHLESVRKHFLIKRIYERRLQENNRALFQLNF